MAKQIKKEEIIEKDVFSDLRESAINTQKAVKALEVTISAISEASKQLKGAVPKDIPTNSKGLEDLNRAQQQANELAKMRLQVDRELQKEKVKLQQLNQEYVKQLRAEIALENEELGTLERLKVENALLRKEREKLNLETAEGTKRLKEINAQLDKNNAIIKESADAQKKQTLNVGNYEGAVKSLRGELRELTQALATMETTDPRFQEMANRAGEIRDAMGDARGVIESTAGTAVENLSGAFVRTGQVGIAAFQGIESAMALMGVENEQIMQGLLRLQALAGLSDALQELGGLGDKLNEIRAGLTAAASKMGLFTTATVANTTATTAASKASQVLSMSMRAIPIVALITGIIAIVANFDKLKRALTGVSKEQETYNQITDQAIEAAAEELSAIDKLKGTINDATISRKEKNQAIKDLQELYPDLLGSYDAEKLSLAELNRVLDMSAKLVMLKAQAEAIATLRAEEYKKMIQASTEMQRGQNASWWDYTKAILAGGNAQLNANIETARNIKQSKDQINILDELDKGISGQVSLLETKLGLDKKQEKSTKDNTKAIKEREEALRKQAEAEREVLNMKLDTISADEIMSQNWEEYKKQMREIEQTTRDIKNMFGQGDGTDGIVNVEPEIIPGFPTAEQLAERAAIVQQTIETLTEFAIKNADERIAKIDEEMQMQQKQADLYRELAANGTITAKESLAEQDRLIAESNRRKQEEERRKQRILMVSGILQAYNSNLAAGDNSTTAFTKAITSSEVLKQFIASLPTFLEGTENTGPQGSGIDGKGGFLSVLHPNERVLTAEQNAMIGNISNDKLAEIMHNHRIGKLIDSAQIGSGWESMQIVNELMSVKGEISEVKRAIIEKPETNIELGRITQSVVEIVETRKTPKLITKRTTRVKP